MKLTIRSLFLKIFIWFWATAIATGIALIITFVLGPGNVPSRWHSSLTDTARSAGMVTLAELERGGVPAASAYIARFERDTQLRACLFDLAGHSVVGNDCGTFAGMRTHVMATGTSDFGVKYGIVRVALMLPGHNDQEYIFATELPAGPRAAFGIDRAASALRFSVALLVSGFICYLLTRYLTTPILRLREASQQLAAGNLSIRAAEKIGRRHDELGALVQDFDVMADRIGDLISRQRQLIYDISHELRSPLARLNVALDLARKRRGADPAFDHMERDIERLNEMIGRLLTIARLDTAETSFKRAPVNLTELVLQIAYEAGFEAQKRNVAVALERQDQCLVRGNAELLYSAIENVVRNAIHYTAVGTTVRVALQSKAVEGVSFVLLTIGDSGPGVPECDLAKIFQPFYRVTDARDRESGGTGLGLAIADRVIRIHGGTIHAENIAPQGLLIHIMLPKQEG